MEKDFDDIFLKYSQSDIAISLFVLSSWNTNRAADLKLEYAYGCYLSCRSFSSVDKIQDYSSFSELCESLIPILPAFPSLEDFVPEGDWGNIKYFYDNRLFCILYGSKLSWPYEFLTNFEILCSSLKTEIRSAAHEDPLADLEAMLTLSDLVVTTLRSNPPCNSYDVAPGHIEKPSEEYWTECVQFLNGFQTDLFSESFLKRFTISAGAIPSLLRDLDSFVDASFNGRLIRFMFVQSGSLVIPVNPRWYISTLIDSWGETFTILKNAIKPEKPPIPIRVGVEVGKFARCRLKRDQVHLLASATKKNEKPDDFIFPFVIQSGDSLYLFSFLQPFLDPDSISKGFLDVHKGIEEAKTRFDQELTLALHLQGHFISYQGRKKSITPKFVVVAPHLTTGFASFNIPKDLDAELLFMEQLLGIFDELKDADEFDKFMKYLDANRNKTGPLIGSLDHFGSFRDSHSVLVDGAIEPTMISLDPHWGTEFRYRSLSDFWKIYPRVHLFEHPRSWKVSQETPTRTRLIARSFMGSSVYFEIGDTACYVNAPFHGMDYQLASLTDAVTQCLQDYLSELSFSLKKHRFFRTNKMIQVLVFPKSLISNPELEFGHLKHLECSANPFSIDCGVPDHNWIGFRYVFDDAQAPEILSGSNGREGEIRFVRFLLEAFNSQIRDETEYKNILSALEGLSSGKPRYTVSHQRKKASFPDVVQTSRPEAKHFKLAKKVIAIEAKQSGLEEGQYDLNQAKRNIDILLKRVVAKINALVCLYNIKEAVPEIIQRIDALVHRDEIDSFQYKTAPQRDIAYDLTEKMTEQHREFTTMHRNYRYLIEKFVQLSPSGNKAFDDNAFQELVALIDWFFVFVSAGDQIFHGIFPAGLEIDRDYKVDVVLREDKRQETEEFGKYVMNRRIGVGINPSDKVESPTVIDDYLNAVDSVFLKVKGFLFRDLINMLQVLAVWGYQTDEGEKTFYFASKEAIVTLCLEVIKGGEKQSISNAIEFLILRPENLCKVIGKNDYPEIPIWEHYKRHSRYLIRPLIEIGEHM
ncbi:MAG TPA: hypothetical protein VJB59_01840 [Bdellovibrionota bacterium]|nr:hypothetical protein [Bdellovibrionota bacterium]